MVVCLLFIFFIIEIQDLIIEYLRYSGFLFRNIDRLNTGIIRFEDLVVTLSILVHGSMEDRVSWIFDLYDLDKDGILTRMVKNFVRLHFYVFFFY